MKKVCDPDANSINLDVKIVTTFVEPLQYMIAFRVLGPAKTTRTQHGQRSHDTAVAGHAGSIIIKDLTAGDPQRLGLMKQFCRNFDAIFTAAGEFTLNFLGRALTDAIAKLDKIKCIKPFSDPAALHWLDEMILEEVDLDVAIVVDFCKDTLFKSDPSDFNNALAAANTAIANLQRGAECFCIPCHEVLADAQKFIMIAEVTKTENRILGTIAECKDKPMKLKRVIGDIYTNTPAHVQGNIHEFVHATVDKVAPHAKKAKKLAE